jgi:hypothetical protein
MKQEQFNQENQQIGQLLGAFLKGKKSETPAAAHLDEDSISAFVDGALSNREAEPIMKHLVGCSPCRKITAQLARLAEELNEQPEAIPSAAPQTNRLQQFMQTLGLSSLGLGDEAVFAHNDSAEEDKKEDSENQNSEDQADDSSLKE